MNASAPHTAPAAPTGSRWFALAAAGGWLATAAVVVTGTMRAIGSDARELAANLQDDSFYYLLPAYRAWSNGGVLSFDGEHPMFGVQPAFAAVLVALAGLCPNREAFLRAAIVLAYALYAATAWLLGAFVRERLAAATSPVRARLAGDLARIVWCLDVPVLFGFTTLKENVLYAPLLLLAWRSASRIGNDAAAGAALRTRRSIALGALLGLGLATRLTPGSLLLAAAVAWLGAPSAPRGARARALFGTGCGAALAALPFACYGLAIVGHALPTSGAVKTDALRAALADGSYWTKLPDYLAEVPRYLVATLRYATGLPHDYFSIPQTPPPPHHAGPVIATLAALGLVGYLRSRVAPAPWRALLFLFLAACCGNALTPLLLGPRGEVGYYQWYVAGLPALVAVACGGVALLVATRVAAFVALALAIAAAAQLAACVRPAAFRADAQRWVRQMIATGERMNALLPPDGRVAAANAGALGFFARPDLVVVNVDGLANDDWLDAQRAGSTLSAYLDRERIEFLCDVPTWGGFEGRLLDRMTLLAVEPFRGPHYDGYFLVRRDGAPFPDFWPRRGPHDRPRGAATCVPWLPREDLPGLGGDAPWGALASGQFGAFGALAIDMHAAGEARPVFYPGGAFDRLGAAVGGADGRLVLRAEGEQLAEVRTAADTWTTLDVDVHDVARAELEFTPAGDETRPLWIAGIRWTPTAAAPEPPERAASHPFGHGCASAGLPTPRLTAESPPIAGATLRLAVRDCAAKTGMLGIASQPDARRLGEIDARDPCFTWTSPAALVVMQPFQTQDGAAVVEVALPTDLPRGRYVAQAVAGLDRDVLLLSNGLLLLVAPE